MIVDECLDLVFIKNMIRNYSKALLQTCIIILFLIIFILALFLMPESAESLSDCLFNKAMHRLNEVPTEDIRFNASYRLFAELLPHLLFVGVTIQIAILKKIEMKSSEYFKATLLFLFIGLVSSVPLMPILVQKGFSFVPSLPYFAIGLLVLIGPVIYTQMERLVEDIRRFRITLWGTILLLAAVVTFPMTQIGKANRNKELFHDVYVSLNVLKPRTVVSISKDIWNNWSLQCFLARSYGHKYDSGYPRKYCIIDRSLKVKGFVGTRKIPMPTPQCTPYMVDDNGTGNRMVET
jgi:hypothetical protein